MNGYNDKEWHLDKRVPLALILTLIVQTSGVVWWAAVVSEKLSTFEHQLSDITEKSRDSKQQINRQALDLAVLAEQVRNTNQSIQMVSNDLKKTNEILRDFFINRGPSNDN